VEYFSATSPSYPVAGQAETGRAGGGNRWVGAGRRHSRGLSSAATAAPVASDPAGRTPRDHRHRRRPPLPGAPVPDALVGVALV